MGADVPMPPSPLARGEKLYCVSYAPFRGMQSPLNPPVQIEAWQIDEDLAKLSQLTDCVRTYRIEFGLDRIPEIAKRHGMKVIQGIWLSGTPEKNRVEIDTAIRLAKQFPDVIRALVVGNEVLLRGEMTAKDLAATIRNVKSQAGVPVTYADVWEFWLRYRDVYDAVDFVTIHILPYWEGLPDLCAGFCRACGFHPPQGRGRVSEQGHPDRRDRIPERGTHAPRAPSLRPPTRRG
jgi:glucan 1,3-beta-glucosidase